MEDWISRDKECILPTYARLPIVPMDGEGCYLIDVYEKQYLDLFSGLGVNVLGYNNSVIGEVMLEYSSRPLHLSNFYYNTKAIELAEGVIRSAFKGKVFYTNSGTEAVEAMIKYVFKYGQERAKKGIISFKGSFHGRTLGALKLTRQASVMQEFPVTDYPVYQLDMGDSEGLKSLVQNNNPAAIVFECLAGSGGIHQAPYSYVKEIESLCREHRILLCVDEIQTGMGRTGKVFAYQNYDIRPDIITFAKGVGGGLPLGGMLVSDDISEFFKAGDHGTTFGPNYLACALGSKVLNTVSCRDFLENVTKKGEYIKNRMVELRIKYPEIIGEIRGMGLMLGIDLNYDCKKLQHEFLEHQVLVNITGHNVLRLLPPLIIEYTDIDYFISTFDKILSDLK